MASDSPPAGRRFSPAYLGGLVLQLLVVFLGVLGAFWAERYRESLAQQSRTREVYVSLWEEIGNHTDYGRDVWLEYGASQAAFDSAAARGERPIPWHLPWRYGGPPTAAWDATLASGGVELLDRVLFYQLAKYYHALGNFAVPLDGRDPFAEEKIVPYELDPEHFYVAGTAQLKPEYREYLRRRRVLLDGTDDLLRQGEILFAKLQDLAFR